jgi:hypothetical protein
MLKVDCRRCGKELAALSGDVELLESIRGRLGPVFEEFGRP